MLGDFINRCLILLLGYAYPAFECYKAVERNKIDIEILRFWCQYWILMAFLTVFERVGDIFVSWVPMYGEMKLAIIIYLWYPRTKGTGYVYSTFFRPVVARHENDIERKIQELRTKAWDFVFHYFSNCAELGQSKFFDMLQYLASQSVKKRADEQDPSQTPRGNVSGPGSVSGKNKKGPPSAPPLPDSPTLSRSPKSFNKGEFEEDPSTPGTPNPDALNQARFRLRRTNKPQD